MTTYIYKIQNKINGKIYIGATNNLAKRIREHKNPKSLVRLLARAIQKYGTENFSFESVYSSPDEDLTRNKIEAFYIKMYNSHYIDGHVYNIDQGGQGGRGGKFKHSDDFKSYLSALYKGKAVTWTQDPIQKEIIGKKISDAKKNDPKNKSKNNKKYKFIFENGSEQIIDGLKPFSESQTKYKYETLRCLAEGRRKTKYIDIIKIIKV